MGADLPIGRKATILGDRFQDEVEDLPLSRCQRSQLLTLQAIRSGRGAVSRGDCSGPAAPPGPVQSIQGETTEQAFALSSGFFRVDPGAGGGRDGGVIDRSFGMVGGTNEGAALTMSESMAANSDTRLDSPSSKIAILGLSMKREPNRRKSGRSSR